MDEHRKLRVFLCHCEHDTPSAREIHEQLSRFNWVDPWLAETRIMPGQDLNLEQTLAIEAADVILVCFSAESITHEGYIQQQFKAALRLAEDKPAGTIFIIPLLLDECTPPDSFRRWRSFNYFSEEETTRLVDSLRSRATSLGVAVDGRLKFRLAKRTQAKPSGAKSQGFRFFIEMMLGFLLPSCACLLIFIAAASRKYFEGMWVTGERQIVVTSLVFFVLLILSFVVFMVGLGRLTTSTVNAGAKIPWAGLFEAALKGLTSREILKEQAGTFLDTSKTFWQRENWVDPEFKERVGASLKSLVVPGWGLWSRGRIFLGIGLLIATTVGYVSELLPGLLLHLIAIVLSGVMDDKPDGATALHETNV